MLPLEVTIVVRDATGVRGRPAASNLAKVSHFFLRRIHLRHVSSTIEMHEVVTLQFGQQANYLGTHYWNTQEAYFTYAGEDESPVNHDVSFRPGIGADGAETYTPRTVIYDLKGAFGTLRRENALYELQRQENPAQGGPWSGSTIPLQLSPIAPSPYQQALDQGTQPPTLTTDTIRFWSDYNHIFYHPRSIVQLNDYELNSSLMPFERWSTGQDFFNNLDHEHDILDRDLRPFLEECDQLQAIQIFAGTDDAWGGFTSSYLERISDDMGKGCRWVFGLQDANRVSRERQDLQFTNAAHSLYAINSSASIHIPVAGSSTTLPSYLSILGTSRWHTSALQAAVTESLTLPSRLRSTEAARATFDTLESALNGDGLRRLAACGATIKDLGQLEEQSQPNGQTDSRMTNGYIDEDTAEESKKSDDISLFPTLPRDMLDSRRAPDSRLHVFSKLESLRGPWRSSTELQNAAERLHNRLHANGPRISVHQSHLLFPILPSFPSIFRFPTRPQKLAIESSLATSTSIADHVRRIEQMSRRMVGIDEREALCDGLAALADEYREGWDSDGEYGDDD